MTGATHAGTTHSLYRHVKKAKQQVSSGRYQGNVWLPGNRSHDKQPKVGLLMKGLMAR